jgi:hypothetical protein
MPHQIRYESAQHYDLVLYARDRFSDLMLMRYCGDLGSRRGGEWHTVMADSAELALALTEIARRRRQHTYVVVSPR